MNGVPTLPDVGSKPAIVPPISPESLGFFRLGDLAVEVCLDWKEHGGRFYFMPEEGARPRIHIGCKSDDYGDVLSVVIHEAGEMLLASAETRFEGCGPWGHDHADYIFVLNHPQFTTVCEKLGWFLFRLEPVLKAKWDARRAAKT